MPNTNPRCHQCGGETWGPSQWCPIDGDQREPETMYRGGPENLPRMKRDAGEERCPHCGGGYSRFGLNSHVRWCVRHPERATSWHNEEAV